ncbi:NadS family protein [Aeromonas hydrophila]|uniref:NadS family protein n=1 Tax=Aeromonas hydrophila TaxID=644 RepID=UPI002B48E9F4|nr:NadS family protein [Aeromonas hydrophila]
MDLFKELESSLQQAIEISSGQMAASRQVSLEVANTKSIREELNITQKQLAELLNTSVDTIKSWESGRRNPSGLARKVLLILSEDIGFYDRLHKLN